MNILETIWRKNADRSTWEDLYYMCLDAIGKDNVKEGVKYLVRLAGQCERVLRQGHLTDDEAVKIYKLHERVLHAAAKYDFDSYMLYIEWDREPSKKFYYPRRKILRPVVDALQQLADGDLRLLAISLPPGVGKTTLAIFFLTWMAGKFPDEPMLSASHSNSFIRGVYDEVLRILDPDGEYRWHKVFSPLCVSNTNAKDCRIDIGKTKRFETLEFTSIGTGNAGKYRAMRLLYCDDLVSGFEIAISKERLDKLWETYATDLRQRKQGDHCAELHIATRWSVHDVIGRLEREYADDPTAKFISVPAVDEDGNSNFDYPFGVGFSTETYKEQREIMDDVMWRALYMNEPIDREGQLYELAELRRYYSLPEQEPDAIIAVCDTKDKGDDYCVQPIAYQYGSDYYIESVICDNGKPELVEPRLSAELVKHHVQTARYESNSAGGRIAQAVQEAVRAKGGRTSISTKFTTANKETKIVVNSPFVKEHFLFKDGDSIAYDKDYKRMLEMLCTYTMVGKNKHDDVPDALAMLAEYIDSFNSGKAVVMQRFF